MRVIRKLILGVVLWFGVLMSSAPRANGEELGDHVAEGLEAIRNENWKEGLRKFEVLEGRVEERSPRMGVVKYHLGFCRLKLAIEGDPAEKEKLLEKAASAFEASSRIERGEQGINIYRMRSLLQLGVVRQAQRRYAEAVRAYEKFLLNRDQLRDVYDRGLMLMNLAICQSLREEPRLEEARGRLEQGLAARDWSEIGDEVVMSAFQAVVRGHLAGGGDVVLAKWLESISTLLDKVDQSPDWQRKLIFGLSVEAANAEMWQSANELLELVSGGGGEDFQFLVKRQRVAIQEGLGKYGEAIELLQNMGGNIDRDDNLYQVIRLSGLAEDVDRVREMVVRYRREFPDGKHREKVRTVLLEALLSGELYGVLIETLENEGVLSEEDGRYLCQGYYFAGRYEDCLSLSRELQPRFKEGIFSRDLLFFEGASLGRMQFWREAGVMLDRYLEFGEEVSYLPLALFERALVFWGVGDADEPTKLLNKLLDLESQSALAASAYHLLGNIKQSTRQRAEAERLYLSALEIGRRLEDGELQQESLFYLIEMLGQEYVGNSINENVEHVLPYVDEFLREFPKSRYGAQVMVAAFPAMKRAGRMAEYAETLAPILQRMSQQDRTPGLDLAVNAYARALQAQGLGFAAVEKLMLMEEGQDARYAAVMRDGLAEIYRGFARKAWKRHQFGKGVHNEVRYRRVYSELADELEISALPPYVALNVASYLKRMGGAGDRTKALYESARDRGVLHERLRAELGLADLAMDGGDLKAAAELLERVIERAAYGAAEKEEAFRMAGELYRSEKNWQQLAILTKRYFTGGETFLRHRGEMMFLRGLAFEERGMLDDAIVAYGRIYASHLKDLEVSAEAVLRLAKLGWRRNLEGDGGATRDRQVAYQLGHRYLAVTRGVFEKRREALSTSARQAWSELERLVGSWGESGEVRTVEQLLEDRRRGRRSY